MGHLYVLMTGQVSKHPDKILTDAFDTCGLKKKEETRAAPNGYICKWDVQGRGGEAWRAPLEPACCLLDWCRDPVLGLTRPTTAAVRCLHWQPTAESLRGRGMIRRTPFQHLPGMFIRAMGVGSSIRLLNTNEILFTRELQSKNRRLFNKKKKRVNLFYFVDSRL